MGSNFRKVAANKITLTVGQASQLALDTTTEQPTTSQKTVTAGGRVTPARNTKTRGLISKSQISLSVEQLSPFSLVSNSALKENIQFNAGNVSRFVDNWN